MSTLDAIILITSLIYVFLATRENVWCWFWGIISCSLWAYASFEGRLYADAFLQLFYVGISFWGIYQWRGGHSQRGGALAVAELPIKWHLAILIGGVLVSLPFGYFLKEYTYAAATYLDSVTTVFAIITTFMVARKILSNWLYWIVIDLVYVYLYSIREMQTQAWIMIIYIGIAILGYFQWRKKILSQTV